MARKGYGAVIDRLRARWQGYRRQRAVERLNEWYSLSCQIWKMCGEALQNERVGQQGPGVILDQIDRALFRLSSQPPPVDAFLRRRFPQLAQRVNSANENVYHLRNYTALFLIHCQGPTPAESTPSEAECLLYYQRAMDRQGVKALALWRELEGQFALIQEEMRRLEF